MGLKAQIGASVGLRILSVVSFYACARVLVGACECVECILVTDRQPRDGEERWQGLNEKTNGLMRKIVARKIIDGVFNETPQNIWPNSFYIKSLLLTLGS